MERKIVLFDIDGTLIDCVNGRKNMSQRTQEALHRLKEAGHYILIASGRPYCYLTEEMREFGFDGFILNDGSYILFHGQEMAYHPIEVEKLNPILQQVLQKNMTFVGYTKKYAYVLNDDGSLEDYACSFLMDRNLTIHVDDVEDLKDSFLKIHVQCRQEKDYQNFILNDQDFFCSNDEPHLLKEIYSRQYTKATALEEILERFKIKKENSYFFGDGFNDIEMMETVGYAIAMGNAHEEVKSHANDVCKSVLEDGVADYIMNSNIFF